MILIELFTSSDAKIFTASRIQLAVKGVHESFDSHYEMYGHGAERVSAILFTDGEVSVITDNDSLRINGGNPLKERNRLDEIVPPKEKGKEDLSEIVPVSTKGGTRIDE